MTKSLGRKFKCSTARRPVSTAGCCSPQRRHSSWAVTRWTGVRGSFAWTASDPEDGDLTASLVWTSDLDGQIVIGGSVPAVLGDGTHTVTDSVGNTSSDTVTVTVGGSSGGPLSLSANGYKVRGQTYIDLKWTGASTDNVDVYRNGSYYAITVNVGEETVGSFGNGGGSDTFKVCEEGRAICSKTVTVNW